jgi:hypothetical protein
LRIALHSISDVGARAGKILLAERDLTALGLYGASNRGGDRRTMAITELTGFDVLATDDIDAAAALAGIAADDGLSCVLAANLEPDPELVARFEDAGTTLLVGANLATGIAETLAAHEIARTDADLRLTIGWTTDGKPRRKGEAVPFPDPVGARWGERVKRQGDDPVPTIRVAVPHEGRWGGAVAQVSGSLEGDSVDRIVGVADEKEHLGAIALAAGAVTVAEGAFGPGLRWPRDAAHAYLETALRLGLGVAALG